MLNGQKWSGSSSFSIYHGPFIPPNLFLSLCKLHPRFTLSKLYFSVPSFFLCLPCKMTYPLFYSWTPRFIFSLPSPTITPLLSSLSSVQPSSITPSLNLRAVNCHQLKWKRDECFSAKTSGTTMTLWQIKHHFSSKMAATHCIIIELISKICACPVSWKGDPDLRPGWDQQPL